MTEEKTKTLSVRVTETLFNQLKQEADEQEISLAEHVRSFIENDTQSDDKGAHTEYIKELKIYKDVLPKQTIKTLRGQALTGDLAGAKKGLIKVLERRRTP